MQARSALLISSLVGFTGCYSGRQDGVDANATAGPGGSADGGDAGDGGGDGGPVLACADPDAAGVGAVRLRRLNRTEYANTLVDLGLVEPGSDVTAGIAGDMVLGGAHRGFVIGGPVDDATARDLVDAALQVSATAALDPAFVGCDPAAGDDEDQCAQDFLVDFGRRAFRRPLTEAEVDALLVIFGDARDEYDFASGIEAALAALLTAPEVVYLFESDPPNAAPGDIVALDDFALASRLSYFLWDSTPDDELLDAAEARQLTTDAGLEQQIRRMLAHPRAHDAVREFMREWTFVDGLGELQKGEGYEWMTADLAQDLRESLMRSLDDAVWGEDATLRQLVAGDTMYVNDAIAEAYGLPPVGSEELVEVAVDRDRWPGAMVHPGLMALQAKATRGDPIARGLFVREQLLCDKLPAPPAVDENGDPIDFDVPPPTPDATNRDRFAEHTASPLCAGCHAMIDPIGFGFEHYDAGGRFREVDDNGLPIDASGSVVGAGDLDGEFDGARELADRMADSEEVAACVSTQWFRFALSRLETEDDECSTNATVERFVASGYDLEELLVAMAMSDSFRFRKVGDK